MFRGLLLTGLAMAASLSNSTQGFSAEKPTASSFGKTKSGEAVEIYTLKNDTITAKVMTLGATLVELQVPDASGKLADVVLGWDSVEGYQSSENPFFGCTTGRVCNRIANGKFTLDGKEYTLAVNNGPNHLHGGKERSLDKVVWAARPFANEKGQGVEFKYTSPDGEEGYPGNVDLTVTYFVPSDTAAVRINYVATTDKATPLNLTNHSYFNLAGAGTETVLKHRLRVNADSYTAVDDTLIPTGKIESVEGTPLDFRKQMVVGDRIDQLTDTSTQGYDHNYVLNAPEEGKPMRLAAVLVDPASKRQMRVMTTEPAVQLYTGNFLNGQTGKDGKMYPYRSALCLETQHYPDSVNHPEFPTTILKPGDKFTSQTVFTFGIAGEGKKE